MRGLFAQVAEVVGGSDDACAKNPIPDPIYKHPSGQWIGRTCDQVAEFEPAAVLRR